MEIQNKIGEQVFDKLRTKFSQITLGDEEGNSTQNPSDAVFFNFNYTDNQGHDHGNITVSLIDRTMKVYYSKNISTDLDGSELSEWYKFLQDMRKTAMSNLYQFDTHDISKSALDIADIQSTVTRNDMKESKMYGSKQRSYQECGPAKIIVRHNESIDPEIRGARSRKIESVFIETAEGERFKMESNSLPGARAMAQHIGQGGRPYDDIGESIVTMVNEIASLRPFVARNRNAIYEDETTMEMVEAAREYYAEARKSLGKLKGKRGYKAYAESFEVTEQTSFDDDDIGSMKDRFTKKRFSDKMEAAMPVVQKAYSMKKGKPSKPKTPSLKPITEFEEWVEEASTVPVTENCSTILSDEEIAIVHQFLNQEIMDLPYELEAKLVDHYADEIPYGWLNGDDGTPQEWLFDKLDMEYGDEVFGEAKEEMCSTECCGKPVSQCHCGPECPHCDCFTKNSLKISGKTAKDWAKKVKPTLKDEEQIDEVKSGPFKSKVIGRRAKVHGQSDFGDSDYDGQIGEIYRASREHTFSSMVPFKVIYGIRFDDGETREYRRESVRPVKVDPSEKYQQSASNPYGTSGNGYDDTKLKEGTWAVPDTPEKAQRLEDLLAQPLPLGPGGEHAASALYDLIGDDELFDELYSVAQEFGPEHDARMTVETFIDKMMQASLTQHGESLEEGQELTDSIMQQMIHKLMAEYPGAIRSHGMDYVYATIEDAVSWVTDDWPEDQGFGSSDRGGIWRRIVKDLELEQGVGEARGRQPQSRMKEGDVVLPKATYSDYLEVYKSSAVGGTDSEDDAKRMVSALQKKGKSADHSAAKGALKRMAEQEAKTGLHMNESLAQLMRDAGITK